MTVHEWLKKEIIFRMKVQQMTQKDCAISLGYSISGLRNLCIKYNIPLHHKVIKKGEDTIWVKEKK